MSTLSPVLTVRWRRRGISRCTARSPSTPEMILCNQTRASPLPTVVVASTPPVDPMNKPNLYGKGRKRGGKRKTDIRTKPSSNRIRDVGGNQRHGREREDRPPLPKELTSSNSKHGTHPFERTKPISLAMDSSEGRGKVGESPKLILDRAPRLRLKTEEDQETERSS